MTKSELLARERSKLHEIFSDVEPTKARLVEGLIEEAAFLFAETAELRIIIERSGMVRVHPDRPELQKPTEVAKQYLKNVNAYAVIIKALNGVLQKNVVEGEDAFDAFVSGMNGSG